MANFKIATWNINSVRLRAGAVARFLGDAKPDVICLQEIKCQDTEFPEKAFKDAGYPHLAVRGQKGHHGVAIASRHPLERLEEPKHCRRGEARCVAVKVKGVEVHNYYAPSGGDEPDPEINDKFAHKLEFWKRITKWLKADRARLEAEPVIITGDLNIAPGEHDVHNHKRLLKYVGHTAGESEIYYKALKAGDLTDIARTVFPEPEQIPTWWSYRVKTWTPQSPGWRLDHILLSPFLKDAALKAKPSAVEVHHHTRTWDRPSDHVPLTAVIKI